MQSNKNHVAGARGGPGNRTRIVFLNALPLNALPRRHMQIDILPVNIVDDLVAWTQRRLQEGYEIVHFIRHPATIAALRAAGIALSEPNSGLYVYQDGDVIVVVTLRNPVRGQEQAQVSPQDLEAWIVTVL